MARLESEIASFFLVSLAINLISSTSTAFVGPDLI